MSQGFVKAQAGIFVEVNQIADQGSPAPLISGWPVEITDGTNILGTPAHPIYTTGNEIVVGDVMISGMVSVQGTVNISGTPNVSVSNFPANAQVMAGPLPGATYPVTGSVTLSGNPSVTANLALPPVLQVGGMVGISGNPQVQVSNFPAIQTIQGTVNVSGVVVEIGTVNVSGLNNVGVNNFPANQQVFGSVTISGNPQVQVSNTVSIQGTVNLSGTPQVIAGPLPGASYPVTGTVTLSGNPQVQISNLPAVQTVQGTINLSGISNVNVVGIEQPVTVQGAVTLSGNPSVTVSNTITVTNPSETVNQGVPAINQSGWPVKIIGADGGTAASVAPIKITSNNALPSGLVTWSVLAVATGVGATTSAATQQTNVDNMATTATSATLNTVSMGAVFNDARGVFERSRVAYGDGIRQSGIAAVTDMMFNGNTYDRLRGDANNGIVVSGLHSGQTTASAALSVVLATDQSNVPVTISNFPTTQNVNLVGYPNPLTVNGMVGISGNPQVQISNTVTVSNPTAFENQGVPAVNASGWPVKITDGITTVAIEPITTAAHSTVGSGLVTFSVMAVSNVANGARTVQGTLTNTDTIVPTTTTQAMETLAIPGVLNDARQSFERGRAAFADTLPGSGIPAAGNMLWNGTSWDRQRGDANNGIIVSGMQTLLTNTQLVANQQVFGSVTLSGTPAVSISNFPSTQNVNLVGYPNPLTVNGIVSLSGSLPQGTNTIGAVSIIDNSGNPGRIGNTLIPSTGTITGFQGLYTIAAIGSVSGSGQVNVNVAANPGDGRANPGASTGLTSVSFNEMFNGTTWDRLRGDLANGLLVSGLHQGQTTASSALSVVIASDQSPIPITGSISAAINFPPVLQVGGMVGVSGNPQVIAGPLPGATYPVTGVVTLSGSPNVTASIALPPVLQVGGMVGISGNPQVQISNFPSTQTINGLITTSGVIPIYVNGGVIGLSGSPTVTVTFPTVQTVNGLITTSGVIPTYINGGQIGISGNPQIMVGPLPGSVFPVAGSVTISGNPQVQVSNIVSIQGTVNLSGTPSVNVANFPATQNVNLVGYPNPLTINGAVSLSGTPTVTVTFPAVQVVAGLITTSGVIPTYVNGGQIGISGNPSVIAGPLPGATYPVTGAVTLSGTPTVIANAGTGIFSVQGTVNLSGTPSVNVANFPATQNVNIVGYPNPLTVNGAVSLSGSPTVTVTFPTVQTVAGLITTSGVIPVYNNGGLVGISGNPQVVVGPLPGATFPVTGAVTISGNPQVQVSNVVSVQGTVNISGTPTVTVSNFPSTQNTNIVGYPNPLTINGMVGISGTPTISVTFPTVQVVAGLITTSGVIPVYNNGGLVGISGNPQVVVGPLPGSIFPVQGVVSLSGSLPAGANVIGHVITDTGSTTAVTGTVAVTQSTTPWVINIPANQQVFGSVTISGRPTVLVDQGSPAVLISGWPIVITDGGGGTATFAASLTDASSNLPNRLLVRADNAVFNGTTWDRMRGNVNDGIMVSGIHNGRQVMANSASVTVAVDQPPITTQGTVNISGTPSINFNTPTTDPLTPAVINFNSAGQNIIVAGITSQTIRVFRALLVNTNNTQMTFYSGTNTALTGPMPIAGSGALVLDFSPAPWYVTTPGSGFNINLSAASQVSGTLWYTQS